MNFGYFIGLNNFIYSANIADAYKLQTVFTKPNETIRRIFIKIKYQANIIDTYTYSGGELHLVYIGLYNE